MSLWNPPPRPNNRPGLPAISYRIGDYNSFRQRLLGALSAQVIPGGPNLAGLTTRDSQDSAIAFLDACAVVADVLTFYQERIANEGYLLTATERRSVLELARAIGYELSPGVAASTYVTFTVDEAASTPNSAIVPQGTQINSVPREGELPQTFETIEQIVTRADWNAIRPRSTRPQSVTSETRQLYLQGIDTKLKPGDRILLIDDQGESTATGDRWFLLDLAIVEPDVKAGHTRIAWERQLSPISQSASEDKTPLLFHNPKIFAFRQRATLFGYNAPRWETMPDEIKRTATEKYIEETKGTQPSTQPPILIKGGVFQLAPNATQWQQVSKGLPNKDILCLVVDSKGVVFAGTSGAGIFRFDADSQVWKAVNTGLTNLNVQALYVDKERGHLFAGTSEGGVFRSKDGGENWVPIHTGSVRVESQGNNSWESINTAVPNTIVRSIAVYTTNLQGTGTISVDTSDINRRTIRGMGTKFTKELSQGSRITASGLTLTVVAVNSDVSLTVNIPLSIKPGTRFTTIISDTSLTISEPFKKSQIAPNSSFEFSPPIIKNHIFIGTDNGIYRSQDDGKNWYPINEGIGEQAVYSLSSYRTGNNFAIIAGTETGLYCSNDNGVNWKKINSELENLVFHAVVINSDGHVLTGTSKGVRSYIKENDTWQLEWKKLRGINIQALAVHRNGRIFVGTSEGIQTSQNKGGTWTVIDQRLDKIDFIALASTSETGEIFAGSRFEGFDEKAIAAENTIQPRAEVASTSAEETATRTPNQPSQESAGRQKGEWPGFRIRDSQQIDLDTLYPQILAGSWIVLLNEGEKGVNEEEKKEAIALTHIERTLTVPRQDFLLDTKVTRLETTTPVSEPQRFNLRSTVVLAQNEELSLAQEQLTVPTQQHRIFLDPLHEKQIFLSQYIQGLKPDQRLIFSGKPILAKVANVGGVFYSNNDGENWQHQNNGLTNTDVRSLVTYTTNKVLKLYTGTSDGVFQASTDVSSLSLTWTPLNQGLTNRDIQALTINSNGDVFAGTPEGIFRLRNGQKTWESVKTGLTHLDVRTIVSLTGDNSQQFILAGAINGGVFLSSNNGDTWTQTGLTNADVQVLAINPNNNKEIVAGTVASGIFYSTNRGNSWSQITEWRPENGSLKSDATKVMGSESSSSLVLHPGDRIKAAGQIRTVVNVEPQTETGSIQFVVDSPFQPNLLVGTPFSVSTGLTNPNVMALAFKAEYIFAGTAGSGVFYSTDKGERWQPINTGLTDLEVHCLTVDSQGHLFVGTHMNGIFRSLDNGETWEPMNQNLSNTDVRTIICDNLHHLFAAGSGILLATDQSYTVPLHLGDILRVVKPPTGSVPEQSWSLMDRNGFQGTLVTSDSRDLLLLPANKDDFPVSEVAYVEQPPVDQQHPVLTVKQPLEYSYDPTTVTISANVAVATHGETTQQVLGSGDGAIANQTFTLQKPPLTYISANTATGSQSTLEVRVNRVLWQEAPSLYGLKAQDQDYIVRIEDDGTTKVIFGDGQEGTRLPTGEENVTAQYRTGIGLEGEVKAGSLTLLSTRPLGVVAVTNPLPATGAASPEQLKDARVKAPASVRTLDRIVSLRDFEDFTQAFAGIGKAQAVVLRNRGSQLVHITIAAIGGKTIDKNANLYMKLVEAIDANRDPIQVVQVDSYEPLLFNLEAKVLVDSRYEADVVMAAVRSALLATFAFERRAFGQSVTDSEVIAAIQAIAGVVAIDLDALYRFTLSKTRNSILTATPAYWNASENKIYPAQLLLVNPSGIELKPVSTL